MPCVGGPCEGYGLLVEEPLPFEVSRGRDGIYVLDDLDDDPSLPSPRYVYVLSRPS